MRPQPKLPEPDTGQFWEATKRHELTYQTCNRCTKVIFYPRAHCPSCGNLESTWHTSRGEGAVYTYTVVMQNRVPAFRDLGTYAVAYVDLDEGFRLMTNIVGVEDPVKDVRCGMRVKLKWEDQGEGEVSLPMFEPMTAVILSRREPFVARGLVPRSREVCSQPIARNIGASHVVILSAAKNLEGGRGGPANG